MSMAPTSWTTCPMPAVYASTCATDGPIAVCWCADGGGVAGGGDGVLGGFRLLSEYAARRLLLVRFPSAPLWGTARRRPRWNADFHTGGGGRGGAFFMGGGAGGMRC